MKEYKKLWMVLLCLALFAPLGLYLPEWAKATAAWGEWGTEEIQKKIGYVPRNMAKSADLWKAPIPDYGLPGSEEAPLSRKSLDYVLSALLGLTLCGGVGYFSAKGLSKRKT